MKVDQVWAFGPYQGKGMGLRPILPPKYGYVPSTLCTVGRETLQLVPQKMESVLCPGTRVFGAQKNEKKGDVPKFTCLEAEGIPNT